jgi:disulfide oxidoreductase YuzD
MPNSAIGNVTSNAAKNVANGAVSQAQALIKSDKMPLIVIIVITVLIFIFVIVYISFAMKSSNLKGKVLLKDPVKINEKDSPYQIANADIPKTESGREYSYGFWMYLENFTRTIDGHKLVLYRGNAGDASSANPLIMLDKNSNKMYIIIKTNESSIDYNNVNENLDSILQNNYFMQQSIDFNNPNKNTHLISVIDYIPLQRWVYINVVVNNKYVTLYMDGNIYSIKSTDEFKAARQPVVNRLGKTVDYNVIIDKTDGDLFVGKGVVGNKTTFDGYIAKVEFFNYALTMEQVKKAYESGPVPSGMLSKLGLSQYGFRSPVYRMNESIQ